MDNNIHSDVLQHHGVQGMKWGVRRYQNKDGSLTKLGAKRYNKEVEKLKSEKAKLAKEKKVLSITKKTKAKTDKLESDKKAVADKRKAVKDEMDSLKGKGKNKNRDNKPQETVEEKRARLLNSSNAKELYDNKDLLTTNEINERLYRIDTEKRLAAIAASEKKTGKDYLEKAISVYKTADNIFKTVNDSAIGKALKKKLGLDGENGGFDLDKAYKNVDKMSDEALARAAKRAENRKKVVDAYETSKKKASDAKTEEAKKEAKKEAEKVADAVKEEARKHKQEKEETWEGTVEGVGTSSSAFNSSKSSGQSWYKKSDIIDADWREVSSDNGLLGIGQSYIDERFLLEDKRR